MIDQTKLMPMPLRIDANGYIFRSDGLPVGSLPQPDGEFYLLARQAFEIMAKRGWGAVFNKWDCVWYAEYAPECDVGPVGEEPISAADPFTAIIQADRWYRENVEAKEPHTDM